MTAVSNSTLLIALAKINRLGVKITGTLGILLLASKDGKLSLEKNMDDLKSVGFHLSEREYKRILSLS